MSELRSALHRLAAHGVPPNEDVACRLTVALDGFLEHWNNETLAFLGAGGSELRFLEAPYGRGKTHCLHVLARTAKKAGFAVGLVQCSAESKPFESAVETYRAVVQSIEFPGIERSIRNNGLLSLLAGISEEQRSKLRKSSAINTAYKNLLLSYANAHARPQLNRGVIEGVADLLVPQPGVSITISTLFDYDRSLPRPLGKISKRTGLAWLHGLLKLPRILGFKGIILLFDETGADLHLAKEGISRKRTHLAQLRNLVDHLGVGALPGVGIIYAAASDLVTTAREVLPPLAQRIERIDPSRKNLRAVWCYLDEMTHPHPGHPEFYAELTERVIALGRDAGIEESVMVSARSRLKHEAQTSAKSLRDSSVRDFVKLAATALVSP